MILFPVALAHVALESVRVGEFVTPRRYGSDEVTLESE
jgi:hypothetical protein